MKYSVLGTVCVGIVCMMVVGCSNSEISTAPESQLPEKAVPLIANEAEETIQAPLDEKLTTYLKGVEDKLAQVKVKHDTLVGHVKDVAPGSDSLNAFDATLVKLKKKGDDLHFQIEAMKSAKSEDQLALQIGMDKTLADLAQSYDDALAQFAG
jgi:hypothetical protein